MLVNLSATFGGSAAVNSPSSYALCSSSKIPCSSSASWSLRASSNLRYASRIALIEFNFLVSSTLLPALPISSSIRVIVLRQSTKVLLPPSPQRMLRSFIIFPIVSGPASPSSLAPKYFWNSLTAAIVPRPYLPSTPLGSKPKSVRYCCNSLIASTSSVSLARPPLPELANASRLPAVSLSPGSTFASASPLAALARSASSPGSAVPLSAESASSALGSGKSGASAIACLAAAVFGSLKIFPSARALISAITFLNSSCSAGVRASTKNASNKLYSFKYPRNDSGALSFILPTKSLYLRISSSSLLDAAFLSCSSVGLYSVPSLKRIVPSGVACPPSPGSPAVAAASAAPSTPAAEVSAESASSSAFVCGDSTGLPSASTSTAPLPSLLARNDCKRSSFI